MSIGPGESGDRDCRIGFLGQPRGLAMLFMVELWERFSYYGMRALLVLFMVAPVASGGLALDTVEAARLYGNYTMAVYLLSIPGGYLADRLLGPERAVVWGGSVIALGHYALAVPAETTFYLGLVLVAVGTGLFKPNISTLVGNLYAPGDMRRDAGFSIFYMGINLGALIAPLVTGFLAQSDWFKARLVEHGFDPAASWHWGFAAAGLGMTISLAIFVVRCGALSGNGHRTFDEHGRVDWGQMTLLGIGTLGLLGLVWISDLAGFQWIRYLFVAVPLGAGAALAWYGTPTSRVLAAIAVLFVANMLFWAVFEQAGLSIALFADQLTRHEVLGYEFPTAWFQSLNSLFVILFAPLFAILWLRLDDRQPSSPVKFALGLALLSAGFLLMVPAAALTSEGRVSPMWLVGLFLLQTLGELCLSPVGLSAMTRLAPARLVGLTLGVWFLGVALGNKLAGIIGARFDGGDPERLQRFFLEQGLLVAAAAVMLLALSPWLRRLMGDVR